MDDLNAIDITELLELEECPVFVVDLRAIPPSPIFFNALLRRSRTLEEHIRAQWRHAGLVHMFGEGVLTAPALQWCTKLGGVDGVSNTMWFSGVEWVTYTIGGRFRIISGCTPGKFAALSTAQDDFHMLSRPFASQPKGSQARQMEHFGLGQVQTLPAAYTKRESIPHSDFLRLFCDFDWASTDLGPIDTWTPELRQSCGFLMADCRASIMYWGPNRTIVYNEAYSKVIGPSKHPVTLGKPLNIGWPEVIDELIPVFNQIACDKRSISIDKAPLVVNRHGFLEELYMTYTLIPILGDNGAMSIYVPCYDVTQETYAEQRLSTLLKLSRSIIRGIGMDDFWSYVVKGLLDESPDLLVTLVYRTAGEIGQMGTSTIGSSSITSPSIGSSSNDNAPDWTAVIPGWNLAGAEHYLEFPEVPKLLSDVELKELLPLSHKLLAEKFPSYMHINDGSLNEKMLGLLCSSEQGKDCTSAVFITLRIVGMDQALGFIIIGLNPRRHYDDSYRQFLHLLQRKVSAGLASAVAFEAAAQRARIIAEKSARRVHFLNESLATNALEVSRMNERFERFRRLAEMSTVGMCDFSPEGKLIQANDSWYKLSGHPVLSQSEESCRFSFMDFVYEPDLELVQHMWNQSCEGRAVTFEMRWKRHEGNAEAGIPEFEFVWILAAYVPVTNGDGSIISIAGVTTDISPQKSEAVHKQRTLEALELKRQQENFIDMTSQSRDAKPVSLLSAIIQCSDSALEIFTELAEITRKRLAGSDLGPTIKSLIENGLHAIETIISCSAHQKRIIDDTLILSKLDSKLLTISPTQIKPVDFLQELHKMFEVEAERSQVEFQVVEDESLRQHEVEWLMLDPSRVLQILINLITNAIKFTREEADKMKHVTVMMGVSVERPESTDKSSRSAAVSRILHEDITLEPEWGNGEPLFLTFTVQDTGQGMTTEEQKRLFTRFSQGSAKTHVQYGGSGLGLFISRELTELQGGEIGLTSEEGVGSSFSFYVKARRTHAPKKRRRSIGDSDEQLAIISELSILVVEDNLVNQKILCKQLAKLGCKVAGAGDGQEALGHIQETEHWEGNQPLSIILMDVEMPVMDGLTCTKRIRELEKQGVIKMHIPIIGTSANARGEQVAEGLAAGMDDAITKPFRVAELIPKMAALAKGRDTNT
ncbi:hypothetical protein B0O99DRAFT_686072 [Bisporella sp. PMI_857]|nr:hypothetical protein B0O99DRAFT_686072 [Bisporella sp. PMI_857]